MELDELKSKWAELDRQISANQALNRLLSASIRQDRLRSAFSKLRRMPNTELLAAFVCLFFLVTFITRHRDQPSALITALSLTAFLWVSIIGSIYEHVQVNRIAFDWPVLLIQRKLLDVKAFRLRMFRFKFLLGMLLWPSFILVLIQGLTQVDPYAYGGGPFLGFMTLCNLLVIGLLALAARRLPGRLRASSAWARCIDSVAGTELARTAASLQELASFEFD